MQSLMQITAKAEFPCRYGMGNTDMAPGDDPAVVFRKWTGEQPYFRFEHDGVCFFMLYTEKSPPARFGFVDQQQMEWLTTQLTEIPKHSPIVLFGHEGIQTRWVRLGHSHVRSG